MDMSNNSSNQLYCRVGARIREIRESRGLTQKELASRISLTRTSIANIETGRQKIQLHTLYEIAAALNIELSTLLPRVYLGPKTDLLEALPEDLDKDDKAWIISLIRRDRSKEHDARSTQTD